MITRQPSGYDHGVAVRLASSEGTILASDSSHAAAQAIREAELGRSQACPEGPPQGLELDASGQEPGAAGAFAGAGAGRPGRSQPPPRTL
ncbi:hypothetical protein [Geothrix sp. SG200]|uniref:hypothetical protein n=1 Tax=Geothrix sp. SG200 TaxID=2922865 RepID=UPI001FAC7ECA|nr:hypothetical protein [Geothrix sp. SG200]